jgi:hypothetical protein
MRESTVAASIVTDMLDYLGRRGAVVADVGRDVDLDVGALGQPDQRIPGSCVERLFEEAERRTKDPHVGLHMGESYHPGALNILGYVVLSCRSAGEVLDRLARYAAILNDGLRVSVTREGETTMCRFDALDGLDNYLTRAPRHPIEAMYAGVAVTMRSLTGHAIEPQEVAFRHLAPSDVAEHRRVFGRDARFGASENVLAFLTGDLEAPVRSSNPVLLEVFERHANAIIDALDEHGPVSRRVVRLLSERVRACLDELQRRGVPHGPLRPLISTDTNGAKRTLFTNVTLLDLSDSALPVDAAMHIFVSDYDPTYVDVASRRARLSDELTASRGGPLGVESMREIVVGSSDVATMRPRWQRLLDPARPTRDGAWQVGTGPAIRIVRAKENRVEALVVRVKSLARAKAFLHTHGLLARGPSAEVMLDPSKVFGINMRLVQ